MNKKIYFLMTLCGLFLLFLVASCSEEVASKTNFIFKSAPKAGVAAKFDNIEITEAEMTNGIENDIFEAEMKVYELKFAKLKAILLEKMMNSDPDKKGLTNDQFLEKIVAKDAEPSEKEIQDFVKEKQIPADQMNDQLKARIKEFLSIEKKKGAIEAWMGKKTQKSPVEVYLKKPERPVYDVAEGSAPVEGDIKSPVTIVEFTDFQCPFCSKGSATMHKLLDDYKGEVKLVFKNFPLSFHQHAQNAHESALCVLEQDKEKFWKLEQQIFANQDKMDKTNVDKWVKEHGVDFAKYEQCLKEGKAKKVINDDIEQGRKIGVQSTPTFFVNGKMVNGALPVEEFKALIDEELQKK